MVKPVDTPGSIVRFVAKVQSANNRKSKDVLLSIQEAIDLSAAMTQLLAQQNALLTDIVELQKRVASGPVEVRMDGGGFDSN